MQSVPVSPLFSWIFFFLYYYSRQLSTASFAASHTTIPVPKVDASSTSREPGTHRVASYMILEYVQGHTLDELGVDFKKGTPEGLRDRIRAQLADVYIQQSGLEFPTIGRLVPLPDSGSVHVGRPPFSNAMNQHQIEVGGMSEMMEKQGGAPAGFTSASR